MNDKYGVEQQRFVELLMWVYYSLRSLLNWQIKQQITP